MTEDNNAAAAAANQAEDDAFHKQRESTTSTQTASTTSTDASGGSKVSFGSVNVHTHRLTMGNNPSVSTGVPLTLGWDVEESEQFDLDEFEKDHPDHQLSRYTKTSRDAIASKHHSRDSIVCVEEDVKDIKHSRKDNETDKMRWRKQRRGSAHPDKKKGGLFGLFGGKK